jgi:hypothetical protein
LGSHGSKRSGQSEGNPIVQDGAKSLIAGGLLVRSDTSVSALLQNSMRPSDVPLTGQGMFGSDPRALRRQPTRSIRVDDAVGITGRGPRRIISSNRIESVGTSVLFRLLTCLVVGGSGDSPHVCPSYSSVAERLPDLVTMLSRSGRTR